MLLPKRVKYRRVHRGRMKGKASRGNTVTYGEWGLQAIEPSWITSNQIEAARIRSEEHTSELQSLSRISYAVFCFLNCKCSCTDKFYVMFLKETCLCNFHCKIMLPRLALPFMRPRWTRRYFTRFGSSITERLLP